MKRIPWFVALLVGRVALAVEGSPATDPDSALPAFVSIESDNPELELVRILGTSVGYGSVAGKSATIYTTYYQRSCRTPCNKLLPASYADSYVLGAAGVTGRSVDLSPFSGKGVRLDVVTGSAWLRITSYLTAALSLGAGGAAIYTLTRPDAFDLYNHPARIDPGLSGGAKTSLAAGGFLLGVVGTILMWKASSTDVTMTPLEAPPPPPTATQAPVPQGTQKVSVAPSPTTELPAPQGQPSTEDVGSSPQPTPSPQPPTTPPAPEEGR